jgi:DNA-binding response OmpR family regulator
MLPDMDGYKVCQTIRDRVSCPIIFLSAMKDEFDHIKGFVWGGDDFVTKPFKLKELLARIRAHLRREKRSPLENTKSTLSYKNLTIDVKCREVMLNNKRIEFTKKEFDIIELLAMHPGQVFSREQIYESIWGNEAFGDDTTVTEFIKKIRLKLTNENTTDTYIATIWGVGYKWEKN